LSFVSLPDLSRINQLLLQALPKTPTIPKAALIMLILKSASVAQEPVRALYRLKPAQEFKLMLIRLSRDPFIRLFPREDYLFWQHSILQKALFAPPMRRYGKRGSTQFQA